MKKGEHAEFSARWWHGSQPKGLMSAAKLEAAFKHYDAARAKLESAGDADMLEDALDALDGIEAAVKGVLAEAGKSKDNPELDATVQSLNKLDVRGERAIAASLVKADDDQDDEDDAGSLTDSEEYRSYLLVAMKKLRNGAMNFGLVLGSKPGQHRIVLHRRKAPKTIALHMVKDLKLHHFSFGIAVPSEDRPQTILLNVQGHVLPGMRKKMERMLKEYRPLPFVHMALFVSGREIDELNGADDDDIDDEAEGSQDKDDDAVEASADARELENHLADDEDDDDDGQMRPAGHSESAPVRLKQTLKALDPEIRAVFRRRAELRRPIVATVGAFVAALNDGDVAAAERHMERVKALIEPHAPKADAEAAA